MKTSNDDTRLARLLIAEDSALVRESLRMMLSDSSDLEVAGEAENGREAVELCRSLEPDLVLMDIRMPEMDGLEATKAIKEAQPEVSVLMVTTHREPDYLLEAVRSGAAGYILKESSAQELLDAVRRVLGGEPTLDHSLAMRLLERLTDETGQNTGHDQQQISEHHKGKPQGSGSMIVTSILSGREIEALRLIAVGKTNRQIAQDLMISLSSVKTYVQRIIKKLGVSDRTQASVKAIELGLLSEQR
jgi:DNA-binding NarL/FixJ family response regulator